MKKIALIVIGVIVLVGGGFLLLKLKGNNAAQAVLKIDAMPTTSIFLDNQNLGKTPYENKVKPGEYTLKLIPESTLENTISWEGKVTLLPNLLTYVQRDLKDSELASSGEVISLEKISGKTAEISIISTPDAATVSIDGTAKGTTPLVVRDLSEGNYEITVSATGFAPRAVKVKSTAGYRLNAVFSLASTVGTEPTPEPTPEPSPVIEVSPKPSAKASPAASVKVSPKASASGSPKASATTKTSPLPKPYVEIQETPTGFLRVRNDASTSGEEVARVNPGEFYALLDESEGWYKIEYESDKEGWVSNQYTKKFE